MKLIYAPLLATWLSATAVSAQEQNYCWQNIDSCMASTQRLAGALFDNLLEQNQLYLNLHQSLTANDLTQTEALLREILKRRDLNWLSAIIISSAGQQALITGRTDPCSLTLELCTEDALQTAENYLSTLESQEQLYQQLLSQLRIKRFGEAEEIITQYLLTTLRLLEEILHSIERYQDSGILSSIYSQELVQKQIDQSWEYLLSD